MTSREFKTEEVLAAIHGGFPMLMTARNPERVCEAFDRLRAASAEMVGDSSGKTHLSWFEFALPLRSVLRKHFADLAGETFPDADHWAVPTLKDPEITARLAEWVESMTQKYGRSVVVPAIKAEVYAKLDLE